MIQPRPMTRPKRSLKTGRTFAVVLTAIFLLALTSFAIQSLQGIRPITQSQLSARSAKVAGDEQCRSVHQARDQCAFIHANCPDEEVGIFSYLNLYYCRLPKAKPAGLLIIALWAALLFSTIGIAASEFFCVNISTISTILGMSESLTGVTFLAFGNGSPDVFSTFAAVNSHSGSMAIGELIGAASFICAVVAGSMAIVRPFKVARKSFVRDIAFFIVAILFSMVFLANGSLALWECAVMVGFYVFYVVVVVCWHSWLSRRKRKRQREAAARSHFIVTGEEVDPYHDDDEEVGPLTRNTVSEEDFNNLESADYFGDVEGFNEDEEEEERDKVLGELNSNMRVTRPLDERRSVFQPIRPSLVGALGFRSVLASLQEFGSNQSIPLHLRRFSDAAYLDQTQRSWGAASEPRLGNDGYSDDPDGMGGSTSIPHAHPEPADGSAFRARAVSANGAAALQLDPSVYQRTFSPTLGILDPSPVTSPDEDQSHKSKSHTYQSLKPGEPSPLLSVSPPPAEALEPGTSTPQSDDLDTSNFLAPPTAASPYPHSQTRGLGNTSNMNSRRPARSRSSSHRSLRLVLPPANSPRISPKRTPVHASQNIHLNGGAPALPAPTMSDPNAPSDDSEKPALALKWWPHRFLPPPDVFCRTLFPTLYGWTSKSFFGKIVGVISAPSFFFLAITLPVVEAQRVEDDNETVVARNPTTPTIAAGLPAAEPGAATLGRDLEPPLIVDDWNRWLVCIQCFTAPLFMVLILWISSEGNAHDLLKPVLISFVGSLIVLLLILTCTVPTRPPRGHFLLCFVGFAVSITWISTIAGEVVAVLKTIGVIFNMSDAILGLTVFAVGNSLGDLVADITVARLGYPVMALAACFGGPLLNILLGIGLSGLYVMINGAQRRKHRHPDSPIRYKPYHIQVSTTLLISAIALLITLVGLLIVVPLNGWRMDRKIGWGLITVWVISTVVNVVVEVAGLADEIPSFGVRL